jgi:hypothetical protein
MMQQYLDAVQRWSYKLAEADAMCNDAREQGFVKAMFDRMVACARQHGANVDQIEQAVDRGCEMVANA